MALLSTSFVFSRTFSEELSARENKVDLSWALYLNTTIKKYNKKSKKPSLRIQPERRLYSQATRNQTACHFRFQVGSFAVHRRDHLRSCLGIISGLENWQYSCTLGNVFKDTRQFNKRLMIRSTISRKSLYELSSFPFFCIASIITSCCWVKDST